MVRLDRFGIDYDLDPYEIPVIGPWYAKIGRVISILGTPCEADPWVMVYAFWSGLPRLAISVLKPDELDFADNRWGQKHRRKKKRRFRIDDLIEPDFNPKEGGFGWRLFKLGSWAQRIGWYMVIIDATLDFAVYWTSTVYTFSGCEFPGAAFCRSSIDAPFLFPIPAGRHQVAQWTRQDQHIFAGDSNSIATPQDYQVSVGASMVCVPAQPNPFPYAPAKTIEIVDGVTGNVLVTDELSDEGNRSTGAAIAKLWAPVNPAHNFEVWITKDEGTCNPTGSRFWCYGSKDVGLNPDP